MPFDPRTLLTADIAEIVQSYGPRDCAIYALGVGLGADPLDRQQLAFAREEDLRVLPSMATVLAFDTLWLEKAAPELDLTQVLHGEQGISLDAPLPSSATVRRRIRVTGVNDKGAGKGAFVLTEEKVSDVETGRLLATLTSSFLCRGDGGRGSGGEPPPAPHAIPDRPADHGLPIATFAQQALLYRLSGDHNPLHVDPDIARASGFPGPVLHGLATYGMACQALLRLLCNADPARFRSLDARFTRPIFPGEPLELLCWIESPGHAAFRIRAPGRDVIAIDNGRFTFA